MNHIVRSQGKVSIVVGWGLIAMGVLALACFVVLAIVLRDSMYLIFLFAPVLLFAGGWLNLWMGRRARLEIQPDQFIWCGFFGAPKSLPWQAVRQIYVPPLGSRRRLAALAQLNDGAVVEIEALWESPTSPGNLLSGPQHEVAQHALIEGHKAYLARHRAR